MGSIREIGIMMKTGKAHTESLAMPSPRRVAGNAKEGLRATRAALEKITPQPNRHDRPAAVAEPL
jgi:hypothetical protein